MKICPNCKYKIETIEVKCPSCGFELMTPSEVRELQAGLKELMDFMHSSVDTSPAGQKRTVIYLDNVVTAIELYQNLLTSFFKKHEEAIKKPKLFRDEKWCIGAKVQLLGILGVFGTENKNFSRKVISEPPPGCFGINFELGKMAEATSSFVTDYSNFVDRNDIEALEKSKVSATEISERLNNTMQELDKVRKQLT
jgi:hypothetical protein